MDGPTEPYYPRSKVNEAALHLARVARAFTNERATVKDVKSAIEIWCNAVKEDTQKNA